MNSFCSLLVSQQFLVFQLHSGLPGWMEYSLFSFNTRIREFFFFQNFLKILKLSKYTLTTHIYAYSSPTTQKNPTPKQQQQKNKPPQTNNAKKRIKSRSWFPFFLFFCLKFPGRARRAPPRRSVRPRPCRTSTSCCSRLRAAAAGGTRSTGSDDNERCSPARLPSKAIQAVKHSSCYPRTRVLCCSDPEALLPHDGEHQVCDLELVIATLHSGG